MSTILNVRSNACPTWLVCLVCTKIYGKNYSCQPINLNKKCKKGIEYKLDFYNKYITRTGAAIKKVKYDHELRYPKFFKNKFFVFDKNEK